jgi:single-strand DNA-binding protein
MINNDVRLIGRLGKDAIINEHEGKKVANFSIATNNTWKDKNTGEKKEDVEWHQCTLWGNENVMPFLKKGTEIAIGGALRYKQRELTNEKGEKVNVDIAYIHIEPDKLLLLAGKKDSTAAGD